MIDEKLIVFTSSPDFSDNSRALYEYIEKQGGYRCFWIIRDKLFLDHLKAIGIDCALADTEEALYYTERAKFLVSTSFDLAYEKRVGQLHISLWHGFGPKTVGFFSTAAVDKKDFEYLNAATTQCDFMVALSPIQQLIDAGRFAIDPRKVIDTGYPRNDFLFDTDGKSNIEKILPETAGSNLILYLPTTRRGLKVEGKQFESNIFNYEDYKPEEIDSFLEKHDAYIVGKLHFADFKKFKYSTLKYPKRVLFIDDEILARKSLTLYHILNAFSCLITDYSSVYSDFMLLDRPIIFSCPDIDIYSKDRGFISNDPQFMMPGGFVDTQCDLINSLEKVFNGEDEFKQYRDFMLPFFHTYKDGDASKRTFEAMLKAAEQGIPDCHKDFAELYIRKESPLSQYTGKCIGELYYDSGNGLNEKDKLIIPYDLKDVDESGYLKLAIQVPNMTSHIRFDPDKSNRVIIEDFKFVINQEERKYSYTNGFDIDGRIFFSGDDPQISLDLHSEEGKAGDGEISIVFKPIDAVYEGAELLAEAQEDRIKLRKKLSEYDSRLNEIYNSNSWKITTPLRKLKGGNLES